MRILLFTGKGGVGKTTLAAATAAQLAWQGHKTLVISTDPAHSLADALGVTLTGEPIEVDAGLHAAQIDSRGLVDNAWQDLRGQLRVALAGAGLDALDAEELTVFPGVDELLALTEVRRLAESGRWQTVVVDCGPTAETLRLLSLPEAISRYVTRLSGWQSKWLIGNRRWSGTIEAIQDLANHAESLKALLTDSSVTTVRLVLTPERVVAAETRRTLTSLALRGIRVDDVIVNRLMPAPRLWRGLAASWMRARRTQQNEVLAELGSAVSGELSLVEYRAREPVGLSALREIAAELYRDTDLLAGKRNADAPLIQVSKVDDGYRLVMVMPLGRESVVKVARVDDDLAVTIDGFRRLMALPEVVRPCHLLKIESDVRGLTMSFADKARPTGRSSS